MRATVVEEFRLTFLLTSGPIEVIISSILLLFHDPLHAAIVPFLSSPLVAAMVERKHTHKGNLVKIVSKIDSVI